MICFKETVWKIKDSNSQLCFRVEYFFEDNFSVGGEFGLRYLKGKITQNNDVTVGPNNQVHTEQTEINLGAMPTYSKISVNFYFGGGKGVSAD